MKQFLVILFFICSNVVFGQLGYAKDSLQIKLYADIDYENNQPKKIEVRKIFCDYCTQPQLKAVKMEGWKRAYMERLLPENRMEKGTKKLTMIIRFAKTDFKAINK